MLNIKLFLLRTYYFYFIFALVCTLQLIPLVLLDLSVSFKNIKTLGLSEGFYGVLMIAAVPLNLLAIFVSFGLYNFRVRRSNQLIYQRGVLGKGKITKILTGLGSNDTPSYQFHYVILQADGKPYHASFRVVDGYMLDTPRGNLTYPTQQFVRYPMVDEEFEVKYIPGNPKYFVILNTGDSEFARHIRVEYQREFIQQLEFRISRTKYLLDADPHNPERQKLYQQAQHDLHNYQQFGTDPVLTESPAGDIVFKTNP
ncbi:hypothetical protein [Neisseria leonii]|uniref:hypothetical protein n=1 Tax=Neisseria leonii TaxID=2995413 RepID=UPI00237A92AE|nr:hypothetical protein [Neisseria sp. 3986]MDD9326621.1 hypothetical protein [Neisseria sp. 3986]